MTYLQRLREDINNIVRSYGYTGEMADLLVDAMSYYVSEHLISLAGQYYNASVFKTKNIDATLQLALDHGVPAYRGENASILLEIEATGPLTFAPLQEIYSIGSNYFYVKSKRYIQLNSSDGRYLLEVVYSDQQSAILEYNINLSTTEGAFVIEDTQSNEPIGKRNFVNDIYIINDQLPISEDVAVFARYTRAGINHLLFLPHTRLPHEFYLFSKNLHNISANNTIEEDIAQNTQYPILILTTPRYGLNVRINTKYLLNVIANNMLLRVVYLNYTEKIPSNDVISSLIDYINNNMPVVPGITRVVDIISYRPSHDMNNLKYMIAEGARYNGVIRSVSDIKHWFVSQSKIRLYDAAIVSVQQSTGSSTTAYQLQLKYLLLYIPVDNVDPNEIVDFLERHIAYIYASLPTFRIAASIPSANVATTDNTYVVNWVPASVNNSNTYASQCPNNNCFDILLRRMDPLEIYITASYVGNTNVNVVREAYRKALNKYLNRIIKYIDPMELFTIFSKLDHVSAVTDFTVTVPTLSSTPFFDLRRSSGSVQMIELLNFNSNNLITQDYYYVKAFNLSGISLAYSV